jgi:hypothetical protein
MMAGSKIQRADSEKNLRQSPSFGTSAPRQSGLDPLSDKGTILCD